MEHQCEAAQFPRSLWNPRLVLHSGRGPDPCLFYHNRLKVSLASYVDDLAARGQRKNCEEAFAAIAARFKCKEVLWLTATSALDHLGMTFFQDETGTYLSMANYIEAMCTHLGVDPDRGRRCDIPMSVAQLQT